MSYNNAGDYNRGQDIGDGLSVIVGGIEALAGGGTAAGGVGVTVTTGGVASLVGVPAAAAGTAMMGHGVMMGTKGAQNFANKKGRVTESQNSKLSSKNEKHGDGGRALTKVEKQINELKEKLSTATGKEKKQIQQKIKNIQEIAQQKKKGEEHSRANKR